METAQFEVKKVSKIIESKETDDLIACLKNLELKAKPLGEGQNGIVLVAEGTPFERVCMKKEKAKPRILCNSVDEEHTFQAKAREAGVNTPLSLLSLETEDGKYIIMQRVMGETVDAACNNPKLLPEGFTHEAFGRSLTAALRKLHGAGIYHRDLHMQNIMIDEKGEAVIIDFGTATYGNGTELTYESGVLTYNPIKGRYEETYQQFKDDETMAQKAIARVKRTMLEVALDKSINIDI